MKLQSPGITTYPNSGGEEKTRKAKTDRSNHAALKSKLLKFADDTKRFFRKIKGNGDKGKGLGVNNKCRFKG